MLFHHQGTKTPSESLLLQIKTVVLPSLVSWRLGGEQSFENL
jgi:hypothetical protein